MSRRKLEETETATPEVDETAEGEEPKILSLEELQDMLGGQPTQNFTYGVSEALWLDDQDDRHLYLTDYIDNDIFNKINYFVLRYNQEDKGLEKACRKPIKLFINSGGGSTYDGTALINLIRCSTTPVWAITTGYCMSMAFHIFVNCHRRIATPTSMFLNHEGEYGDINAPSKVKDSFSFYERLNSRLNGFVAENTKLTKKMLEDENRVENYFFGDEAKEMGVVTDLIGVDCDLDEIL